MNYTEMITAITARDCPYIICRKTAITHWRKGYWSGAREKYVL